MMRESVPTEELSGLFTLFTVGNREDYEMAQGLSLDNRELDLHNTENQIRF